MENFFGIIPNELLVLAISMVPVIELRGAIPVAIALDMSWQKALILCVLGNMLPIPFIVAYLKPFFEFVRKNKYFVGAVDWLEKRTQKKAETMIKYTSVALCLFVAVPLPGTGAWTGAMIAAILGMRLKHAVPSIGLGVLIAGVIVTFISYHLI